MYPPNHSPVKNAFIALGIAAFIIGSIIAIAIALNSSPFEYIPEEEQIESKEDLKKWIGLER